MTEVKKKQEVEKLKAEQFQQENRRLADEIKQKVKQYVNS
jgi:hypothetical protein